MREERQRRVDQLRVGVYEPQRRVAHQRSQREVPPAPQTRLGDVRLEALERSGEQLHRAEQSAPEDVLRGGLARLQEALDARPFARLQTVRVQVEVVERADRFVPADRLQRVLQALEEVHPVCKGGQLALMTKLSALMNPGLCITECKAREVR